MNKTTAESLLRCHRAGRLMDSRMEKAVRYAGGDLEMRSKLNQQLAFDQKIVSVVHCIQPPVDFTKSWTNSTPPRAQPKPNFTAKSSTPPCSPPSWARC